MAINQGAIQVTVTINGDSITIDKENFLNLKIKRYIGDSANSFTLEAFDETAFALESLLMKNKNFAPILVQYCSAKNMNKKITFSGTCFNYQTSFVGKGTLISITGVFSGGDLSSTKYWFEKANIEWCGSSPEWDETNQQWTIDGKGSIGGATDELYTDYLTNENVCAVLKFDNDSTDTYGTDGLLNSSSYLATADSAFENVGLSEDCLYLSDRVKAQCQANGISNMFPVVMAILMQESGGHYNSTPDVFQCSESLGLKPNTLSLEESLKQGPKYFTECLKAANNNIEVALQGYNFGIGFAKWVTKYHPNERFQKIWITAWKIFQSIKGSYGDEKYVEHVQRYYREKSNSDSNSSGGSSGGGIRGVSSQSTDDSSSVNNINNMPVPYFNPSRIFKRILKTYRGEGIENANTQYSQYFREGNQIEDTQWVSGLDTCQANETASEYINRVLCKNAMTVATDADGHSNYGANYLTQSTGFKYFVDGSGHNFVHIDFDAAVQNAPTVTYGSKDSNIISFSTGRVGAIAMTGSLYDENTGALNVDSAVLDDISGAVFTLGGENILGADVTKEQKEESKEYKNWYKFKINPSNIESSASTSSFEKKVYSTWFDLEGYTTTAEMTVWGEAGLRLQPGGFVNVIIYGNGRQHYSTGCYYITSMEDNISSDGYTQTCKMIKNLGNLKVKERNSTIIGIKDTSTESTVSFTFITETSYTNGQEVQSYVPPTSLELEYYRLLVMSQAKGTSLSSLASRRAAQEQLKNKIFDDISEAKKKMMQEAANSRNSSNNGENSSNNGKTGRRWRPVVAGGAW